MSRNRVVAWDDILWEPSVGLIHDARITADEPWTSITPVWIRVSDRGCASR